MFSSSIMLEIKPVFFIFLLLNVFSLKAQGNLVPNPSFEEYYSCPTGNDLNDGQLEKCKYWWKPTLGTSDYFNRCNNSDVGVPTNFWGYQEPFDGDGYVGFVPVCWFTNGTFCGFEYVQTKLEQPLKPCTMYNFRMRVNLADDATHAIGKLGAAFTENSFYVNNDNVLNIAPNIYNINAIIEDSLGWTLINENFIANGKEEFLTIGYFTSDLLNDTIFIQDYLVGTFGAYYYIDSVSLIEIGVVENCDFAIPNVFTPNNDGSNDVWEFDAPTAGELIILNRWGDIVYKDQGEKFSWNGNENSDGVYYYKFITEQTIKTGFIQLIR